MSRAARVEIEIDDDEDEPVNQPVKKRRLSEAEALAQWNLGQDQKGEDGPSKRASGRLADLQSMQGAHHVPRREQPASSLTHRRVAHFCLQR